MNSPLYKKIRVKDATSCAYCHFEQPTEDGSPDCTLGADSFEIGCLDNGIGYIFIPIVDIFKKL